IGEANRFSVIATMTIDGIETIVGEACYGFDDDIDSFEFGLSIDDRWQGQGIGAALLSNLQCRAAALGASGLFGDTLRSNEAMIALARKAGFSFTRHIAHRDGRPVGHRVGKRKSLCPASSHRGPRG